MLEYISCDRNPVRRIKIQNIASYGSIPPNPNLVTYDNHLLVKKNKKIYTIAIMVEKWKIRNDK